MTSCLLIFGDSGNGKTYTSRIFSQKFGIQNISMDQIINFIGETVRLKFGETDPKFILKDFFATRLNLNDEDFNAFKTAIDILIKNNLEYFQDFYLKLIKDKKPTIYYKLVQDRSSCIDLGINGDFLEKFAVNIIDYIFSYLVKRSHYFIIEGYYFREGTQYRKELENRCDKIFKLGCYYKKQKNSFIYELNGTGYNTIEDVEKEIQKLIPARRYPYQKFSKNQLGDSRTNEKLIKLGLPKKLTGQTVLDLGCNEGFYSFECETRGARVLGIERDSSWFDLALDRKHQFSSFVNFVNDDWKCLPTLNYKFDLVLFLGAFHYIKNNQLEILTNVYNRLNSNGLLILEVGILDKNEGDFLIEEVKRPAGDICQFTNKFTIKKLIKDAGFSSVIFYGEGWNIKGDLLPRYIIHARKNEKKHGKISANNIELIPEIINETKNQIPNMNEIEDNLVRFYNRNKFNKKLLHFGYSIMKKLAR